MVATLYLAVPLASLFVLRAPLVTIAAVGAVAVVIAAAAAPAVFLGIVAFLCAAVPKAGFIVGGLPLPMMMFVLLGSALMLRPRAEPAARRGFRLSILALVWLSYRLVALVVDGGGLTEVAALAGWYGLPVLLLLLGPPLGGLRGPMGAAWTRRLEAGIIFACGFGVVQQLGGIEQTALPGVTRAVGVDYSQKPLLFAGGSKIPSTYQNGNILGVVTAFFFIISAEQVLRGRGNRRDIVVMGATAIATLLSGSRTAVIGLGIALAVLVVRSGLRRQTIAIFALVFIVAGTTLYLSPALSKRIVGTKASDPAFTLRTDGWSRMLHVTSASELITGGPVWARHLTSPGQVEGLLGAVQQVGIVGMGLFIAVFLVVTSPPHLRRWRLLLLPVAVSLGVDSAYLVFPTLFLPIARMFAQLEPLSSVDRDEMEPNPVVVPSQVGA